MKITDIYTIKDTLYNGSFEGETLYNKAHNYGRHDICLLIASRKRQGLRLNIKKITSFKKNVHLYEETGEQQYKDKATGRYYHMVLWEEVIRRLRDGYNGTLYAPKLKEKIVDELDLPKPCYACITKCETCPIAERAGKCIDENSTTALSHGDIETAIKYAEVMADAWIR